MNMRMKMRQVPFHLLFHTTPQKVYDSVPLQGLDIYPPKVKRPNPLLKPSSYPQIMAKQLPMYEGCGSLNQLRLD